jgi:hypothetical protein
MRRSWEERSGNYLRSLDRYMDHIEASDVPQKQYGADRKILAFAKYFLAYKFE